MVLAHPYLYTDRCYLLRPHKVLPTIQTIAEVQ